MSALTIRTISSALFEVKKLPVPKQDALPPGFPTVITGKAAWSGNDFGFDETFIYYLSNAEIFEICQGLDTFKGKYKSSTFPRNTLLSLSRPPPPLFHLTAMSACQSCLGFCCSFSLQPCISEPMNRLCETDKG